MLAERFRKAIRAKALSEHTERGYLYTTARWARWIDDNEPEVGAWEVGSHHVDDFIADIIEATSPANGAHHYRNLRVFMTWLKRRNQVRVNPFDETEPPNVPDKLTPVLTDEEHAAVLSTCSGRSLLDLRDTALILLFMDTGIRVSEMAQLRVDEVDTRRASSASSARASESGLLASGTQQGSR
nr:phage integrase N-terminal SAM-like domain-containing protein [Actinoalloteichus spitiensis]